MASMYPPGRPSVSDEVSHAERAVLVELEAMPPDWHVLHSLWLKTHKHKLHAEADFVVITDRAVMVLEVKGGDVSRDSNGLWNFRARTGRTNQKREGPFDQAMGAYYAIGTLLEKAGRSDLFNSYVWGYGVICPDCVIEVPRNDGLVDPQMLLDARGFPLGLRGWMRALEDYWISRQPIAGRRPAIPTLTRLDLGTHLRPQFGLAAGAAARSIHAENEIIQLTARQMSALDFMSLEPRNLLVGAAGTGKTVLAIEQVRRQLARGKKVLFICYNRLLATRVRQTLGPARSGTLEAGTFHQVTATLCRRAGLDLKVAEGWDEYCALLGARSAELAGSLAEGDLYDYLVMDEGQDLMNDEFLELLGCLIKGGLSHGNWMIACDRDQTIYYDNFDASTYARVNSLARSTLLSLNCRNTRVISAYVRGFTNLGSDSPDAASGENPVIRYYSSQKDYLLKLRKVVNDLVANFAAAGISAGEIALLYGDQSCIPEEALRDGFFLRRLQPVDPDDSAVANDAVRLCSIQAFKGLDSRAVVLVGTGGLESDLSRNLFYVGASRARTTLRILLQEPCVAAAVAIGRVMEILGQQADASLANAEGHTGAP